MLIRTAREIGYDDRKMPIHKLSKFFIEKGYEILKLTL